MTRAAIAVFVAMLTAACTGAGPDTPSEPEQPGARSGAHDISCAKLDRYITRAQRGYFPGRSVDLSLIAHEPNYIGAPTAAVHTGPFDFLAEIPLVIYGPGHVQPTGSVDEVASMADVAPTTARIIGFDGFDALDGKALVHGLPPDAEFPRVVVTVVWDGGGWNTLREHPDAWPFLSRLVERGVSFEKMTIGSTPSVTPPIHTTLGTSGFPSRHGITNVTIRTPDGRFIDPMEDNSPRWIETPTLGDIYDKARANRPLVGVVATVNWHFGMIGKGALHPGGDRDVAALFTSSGTTYGDPRTYEIPDDLADPGGLDAAADTLDGADGARDGQWGEHDLEDLELRYASPATVHWMGGRLRAAIDHRGFGDDRVPDLLYTNFKSIDDAGHRWGMHSDEVGEVVAATDVELKRLVEHLNRRVGEKEWVVIVTADHGMMPFARDSGGWAIRGSEVTDDLNEEFAGDGSRVFRRTNSSGIYMDEDADVDRHAVGRFLLDYTAEDNLYNMDDIPAYYRDKADVPLFDAVLAGRDVVARSCRD